MAGPIRIAILANGSQARRETAAVNKSLFGLGMSAKKVAGVGGIAALTTGLVAFDKSAVDTEKRFSTTMRTLRASTGASAAEIERLNAAAVKLGADTSFSANEAATAMLELGKSGFNTSKILAAVPQVMNLAATEGMDLAQAAGVVTSSLAQFKLRANESAVVVNALAGASNASRSSVASLGESLKLVGSAGSSVGLSVNETAAALAALSDSGLDGSVAGTSLAAVFNRLVPQTEKASAAMEALGLDFVKGNGDFENIVNIAGQLQEALAGVRGEAARKTKISEIFGNDASTIAAVNALVNAGSDGLRKYLKATQDQSAAQKLANARMNGTEGALERLSGAMETAKLRLGQEFAPLIIKGADAIGDGLVPAMESGIKAGKQIAKAVAPAAEEIAEALSHLGGEGEAVGAVFEDVFIPALRTASELVGGAVDLIDNLPGPLKEVGLQAGLAALVLPRFQAGVSSATSAVSLQIAKLQQLRAEMTYTATRTQLTEQALGRLSGAARTAAGIGGMVALSESTQQSNKALSTLTSVAGGAAIGFSLGGPWGAAIGGAGGLLLGLARGSDDAGQSVKRSGEQALTATGSWQDYAATLDHVNGSLQRQTRMKAAESLRDSGALDLARQTKISFETLVSASLGSEKAIATVRDRLAELSKATGALPVTQVDAYGNAFTTAVITTGPLADEAKRLAEILKLESGEIQKSVDKTRDLSLAQGVLRGQMKGVQRQAQDKIIMRLQASGWPEAEGQVRKLLRGIKLTPPEVKLILKALGVGDAIKDVNKFADEVSNQAPKKMKDGGKKIGKGGNEGIKEGVSKTKGLWQGVLMNGVRTGTDKAAGPARSGGTGVGLNMGAGMYFGLSKWVSPLATRAYTMVSEAIAAANRAGDIHSPSLETDYTGRMLGQGLAQGLERSIPIAARAGNKTGKAALEGIVRGVTGGLEGVDKALDNVTKFIQKKIDGKNEKKREKAVIKAMQGRYAALRANGRAQDALASGNYLPYLKAGTAAQRRLYQEMRILGVKNMEEARQKLADLTQAMADYRQGILDTITATGDITQLGRQEDGTVSITALVNELENKARNAERFDELIQKLAGDGLSEAQINQMLAAGPEAALATAEAIALGGQASINQINELQKSLTASGDRLAKAMADKYKLAGVQAAQGIVRGLESEAAKIDAAAVRLANALVKAVKKALGIKSPSRVFKSLGGDVIRGLDIGIDDTYVSRTGAGMATSLRKGFGTPAMQAYMAQVPGSAGSDKVIEVHISADALSDLEQGKKIIKRIDVARSAGVRSETLR